MRLRQSGENMWRNMGKLDKGPDAGLLPEELNEKYKKRIEEIESELVTLHQQFSQYSEEDAFTSRQALDDILLEINNLETEKMVLRSDLYDLSEFKDNLGKEGLETNFKQDKASKN